MPSANTSNYLFQKERDLLLKGTAFTPPTALYVALMTTAPTLANTGGVEVSTSGTGYARVAINNSGGWNGPSGVNLEYSNANDITFGSPTANWGTIVAVSLYDAATGGNLIFSATLNASKTVSSGDGAPKILAGAARISRATC